MFATVESSTAAICSNALFDVTQIWSDVQSGLNDTQKKPQGSREPCGSYRNIPDRALTQSITTT